MIIYNLISTYSNFIIKKTMGPHTSEFKKTMGPRAAERRLENGNDLVYELFPRMDLILFTNSSQEENNSSPSAVLSSPII
jgi:hypothetical protein